MITSSLASFFDRDLISFINELRMVPEENLWTVPEGIKNSAGVLGQHIAGNLQHFIGYGLGNTGYIRQREREFMNTGKTREEIIAELEEARKVVAEILPKLDEASLAATFPVESSFTLDTLGMLFQLYHHLSYHLGQLNYLRRIV